MRDQYSLVVEVFLDTYNETSLTVLNSLSLPENILHVVDEISFEEFMHNNQAISAQTLRILQMLYFVETLSCSFTMNSIKLLNAKKKRFLSLS